MTPPPDQAAATADAADTPPATGPAPFAADTRGATAAEYAFLLLLVVAAAILGLSAVGASTSAILSTASTSI